MTTTTIAELTDRPSVRVESDGDVLRGVAIRFGPHTVGDRAPSGELTVYREVWDAQSVALPRKRVAVNRGHDRSQPVGFTLGWDVTEEGLMVEARLSGSAEAKANLRELIRDQLLSDLSVGFVPSDDDHWSAPERRGGLPTVVRRRVRISEVSLVHAAALAGSGVRSVTKRSAEREAYEVEKAKAQAERKASDQALLAEWDQRFADAEARRAERDRLFAEVDSYEAQQRAMEAELAGKAQAAEVRAILREYRADPRYEPPAPRPRPPAIPRHSELGWELRHWTPSGMTMAETAAWLET